MIQLRPACMRLIWACLAASVSGGAFADDSVRLVFTGDVMLAREVEREIALRHGLSPWSGMMEYFGKANWLMGNLEGSVGALTDCPANKSSPCFAMQPQSLEFLGKAGFTAMSVENNHSSDLGPAGRDATRTTLSQLSLAAVDYAHSPGFVKINGHVFSFVALNTVPDKDGDKIEIPSNELRQKLRLARSLSEWVIVSVHWGSELSDWPQQQQRDMAAWLIAQGVDVIIGHHPHVVQPPECVNGRPVFFSLGNHVFDQKYEETKHGLLADCGVHSNELRCSAVETITPMNSSYPEISATQRATLAPIERCSVQGAAPLALQGYTIRPRLAEGQFADGDIVLEGSKHGARTWAAKARNLLAIEQGSLDRNQDALLFTLERHFSTMDQEKSPRPYVYQVTEHGLVAKWRGTSLAWPLVDGRLIRNGQMDYLCALHRGDTFLELDPGTKETRTAVYRWNGFGFSEVHTPELSAACKRMFR